MVAVASVLLPAGAFATPFSSSCDSFQIDGSEFGPHDGVADFVDDFNNGTLAPSWSVLIGTAIESGTTVTFKDPGFVVDLAGNTLEISTIENEAHEIGNGGGDFTMLSRWQALPGASAEFHMQLYAISPVIEAAGLTVSNNGSAGYSVNQSVTQGFGSSFTTLESDSVPIDASSVSGAILLRMTLDDSTDLVTCSFSLDGGTTFHSPFSPMHVFNSGVVDYEVLLGAAVTVTGPPPPPPPGPRFVPMTKFQVDNPSTPTYRRLRFVAKSQGLFGNDFGFVTGSGVELAVQVHALTQCFTLPPGSLWSSDASGNAFTYRDPLGSYGPVKVLSIRRNTNNGLFKMKAVALGRLGTLSLVPPASQANVRLLLPSNGTSYCASTSGGEIVKNTAESFKVKNAPAPSACATISCSPSGAFVD
jgi:hypothetical protein